MEAFDPAGYLIERVYGERDREGSFLAHSSVKRVQQNNLPNGVVQGGTGQSFCWSDNFSTTVFLILIDGVSIRLDILAFLQTMITH